MNFKRNDTNGISSGPLISVIMPCYNNGAYVAQAIESVQVQTYHNWELVIVNDGSTDNSDEVIVNYLENDFRIKYIKQNNLGVSTARNNGVKESVGVFLCFLDADDWLSPDALKQAVIAYYHHPDCRMFYLNGVIIVASESGERTIPFRINRTYKQVLLNGMDVKIVIRRKDFVAVGGFDQSMTNGFEDWEFCIRFLHGNCNIVVSDDILYYYRKNHISNSLSIMAEKEEGQVQSYIYKKNMNYYVEVLGSPIMQYRWADRKLPRLCNKILKFRQIIQNAIMQLIHKF